MAWLQKKADHTVGGHEHAGQPPPSPQAQGSMFIQRALIALTLGPLALYLVYLGGWFYFVPLAAILILASVEYVTITRKIGWHTSYWLLVPVVLAQLLAGQFAELPLTAPILLVSLFVVLAYALLLYERRAGGTVPADWMAMMGGVILFGWLGSHFFRLRGLPELAWQWTMLALLSNWFADSFAYLVGRFAAGRILGRHQFSPRLSPNKTWEGYFGGIVFGTGLTAFVAYLLQLPLLPAAVLGLAIAVLAPLGDLSISLLKREAGVKDSGRLFVGHGGALDRVDSLLWAVALAYYLVLFLN